MEEKQKSSKCHIWVLNGRVTSKDKTNVKNKKSLRLNIKATILDEKKGQLLQDLIVENRE